MLVTVEQNPKYTVKIVFTPRQGRFTSDFDVTNGELFTMNSSVNQQSARPQIDSLQALRLVAACMVTLYHIYIAIPDAHKDQTWFSAFQAGSFGVDIFFVISGFIMVYTVSGRDFNLISFARSRILRIVPPYWFVLAVTVVMHLGAASLLGPTETSEKIDLSSMIVSGLLLPMSPQIMPVAWTLTLELVFYALFAVAYAIGGLRAVCAGLLGWYALSILNRTGVAFAYPDAWRIVHSIVLEFLYGVLIGIAALRGRLPFARVALATGIALTLAHFALRVFDMSPDVPREFERGVPAALLVYGLVMVRRRMPKILVLGGEASYAQYLIHVLALSFMARTASKVLGFNPYENDLAMLAMFLVVVVASILATLWLERPYEAWRRGASAKRAQPGMPVSAG